MDPLTMEVVASISLEERGSYARMAMTHVLNGVQPEDAIVMVGDENVYQMRWRPSSKSLYMVTHLINTALPRCNFVDAIDIFC